MSAWKRCFTELHQQYTFFLPLAGLEKSYTHTESVADVKAAEKMGRLFDLIRERNQISTAEEVHALNPASTWGQRLKSLLEQGFPDLRYLGLSLEGMGAPDGWQEMATW